MKYFYKENLGYGPKEKFFPNVSWSNDEQQNLNYCLENGLIEVFLHNQSECPIDKKIVFLEQPELIQDKMYITKIENLSIPEYESIFNFHLNNVRIQRNKRLIETDYLFLPDIMLPDILRNQVLQYRQQLRDFPETFTTLQDFQNIIWPNKPEGIT